MVFLIAKGWCPVKGVWWLRKHLFLIRLVKIISPPVPILALNFPKEKASEEVPKLRTGIKTGRNRRVKRKTCYPQRKGVGPKHLTNRFLSQ